MEWTIWINFVVLLLSEDIVARHIGFSPNQFRYTSMANNADDWYSLETRLESRSAKFPDIAKWYFGVKLCDYDSNWRYFVISKSEKLFANNISLYLFLCSHPPPVFFGQNNKTTRNKIETIYSRWYGRSRPSNTMPRIEDT